MQKQVLDSYTDVENNYWSTYGSTGFGSTYRFKIQVRIHIRIQKTSFGSTYGSRKHVLGSHTDTEYMSWIHIRIQKTGFGFIYRSKNRYWIHIRIEKTGFRSTYVRKYVFNQHKYPKTGLGSTYGFIKHTDLENRFWIQIRIKKTSFVPRSGCRKQFLIHIRIQIHCSGIRLEILFEYRSDD